jgi:hypothetical protein
LDRCRDGYLADIDADGQQQLAMLRILYGACSTAVDAFRAADNPVDAELLSDLEKMVERTRQEIERRSAPAEGPA